MGLIEIGLVALAVIGSIVVAAAGRLAADEFKAWTPHWTRKLIAAAVARLPSQRRERLGEEWCAHVEETPGELGKLAACLGLLIAARRIRRADNRRWTLKHLFAPLSDERRCIGRLVAAVYGAGYTFEFKDTGVRSTYRQADVERAIRFRDLLKLRRAMWADWWHCDDRLRHSNAIGQTLAAAFKRLHREKTAASSAPPHSTLPSAGTR